MNHGIPIWQIPLGAPPRIRFANTGYHGLRERIQTYRMHDLWCIHWYDYSGEIQIHDWIGEIRPGGISIVPPGEILVHKWRPKTLSKHYYAHFQIDPIAGGPQPVPAWMVDSGDSFRRLMEEVGSGFAVNPARTTAALWQCLWQIAESHAARIPGAPANPAAGIQRQIEKNLAQPISLEKCALACGLSANHANRLFRQATGLTICAYWRKRRIESACGLLAHTSLSVKEVAIQCGYQDLQQFNKLIRLHTGQSPRQIRTARITSRII